MWVYMLKEKGEAFEAFKKFKRFVENKFEHNLKTLRTDRGGEFTSKKFTEFCKVEGVERHLTAPYTPQQNGVVERRNRTVMSTARSLLKSMQVPTNLWGEAVRHAVYLLNRLPTKVLGDCTPYQAWTGKRPQLEHLRVFGCIAHVKIVGSHLKKLDDRSQVMVYLGVEDGSKAHRFLDPACGKIRVSRDVVFEEEKKWEWCNDNELVQNSVEFGILQDDDVTESENATATPSSARRQESSDGPTTEDGPIKFRSLADIYAEAPLVEMNPDELLFLTTDEPTTYHEAATEEAWNEAMKKELESIEKNKTWELTDLPPGHKTIGLKWVFKLKRDSEGNILKHKARLVAKGYVQKQGVDFAETFALVARLDTVKMILALAAHWLSLIHI